MSWSFTVPAGSLDEFDAAVDAAVPSGQPDDSEGLAEDVAVAKAALKLLAPRVKRPVVGGSANGHALQPDEGNNWHDGVSVSVWGVS